MEGVRIENDSNLTKKSDTMEVLLVEPGQYARIVSIERSLEGMQRAVGGYIEAIYPFDDPIALVCDEEGKLNGKELNRALRNEDGKIYDVVAGTFFVCGLGEESFDDLSKDLQAKYEKLFHQPEVFLRMSKGIMTLKVEPEKQSGNKAKFKEMEL